MCSDVQKFNVEEGEEDTMVTVRDVKSKSIKSVKSVKKKLSKNHVWHECVRNDQYSISYLKSKESTVARTKNL